MVTRINNDLQERLRKAEEAEHAVTRLGSLAAEAPVLRQELARAQRQQGWDRARKSAMEECKRKMENVHEKAEPGAGTAGRGLHHGFLPLPSLQGD